SGGPMRGTGRSRARLGDGFPDATGFRRQQDNDHPSCYSLACPSAIFMLRGGLRAHDDWGEDSEGGQSPPPSSVVTTVKALYALQNGFIGFERSGLFYGDRSPDRVQIPVTCYLVRASDTTILFDTGLSPRAVPGLVRTDPLARFGDDDLLIHRLDALGLEPSDVDVVVLSHLHFDHAGGAELFTSSELVVQKDEYAYAHYPAAFLASFYYKKNFDLPGYRWRLLDGDAELAPGARGRRGAGHPPGNRSLLVGLPKSRRVPPAADCCYGQRSIDEETPPGAVWAPTRAMHSIKRLKTIARLTGGRISPSH